MPGGEKSLPGNARVHQLKHGGLAHFSHSGGRYVD
nr:MAG TPA: hypothetical protein [Caudoviricetes sp.]